jgi:hypothetical protein
MVHAPNLDQDLRRMKALLENGASTASETGAATAAFILRVPVPDLCALWAETATPPMNIALIGVVDGEPLTDPDGSFAMSRVRAFIEARLPRAPMLLRRTRAARIGSGWRT